MKKNIKIFVVLITFSLLATTYFNLSEYSETLRETDAEENLSGKDVIPFISITSNADFSTYANGGGNGSASNPWILQFYEINIWSMPWNGIYIKDTTDHFIIQYCTVFYPDPVNDNIGILLDNVENGQILGCLVRSPGFYLADIKPSYAGISIINCNNITLWGNQIDFVQTAPYGYFFYGIFIDSSYYITLDFNGIYAGYYGLYAQNCDYITVVNNDITGKLPSIDIPPHTFGTTAIGINLYIVHNSIIEANGIHQFTFIGLLLNLSGGNTIIYNGISGASGYTTFDIAMGIPASTPNYFLRITSPVEGEIYTGPDAPSPGDYPSSSHFEVVPDGDLSCGGDIDFFDIKGGTGTSWTAEMVANKIDTNGNSHNKVLYCYTGEGSSPQFQIYKNNIQDLGDGSPIHSGSYEFWFLNPNSSSGVVNFQLSNPSGPTVSILQEYNQFKYINGSAKVNTGFTTNNNKWYRISVDFSNDGTIPGLGAQKYRFRIYDSDGRTILYRSPIASFNNSGASDTFRVQAQGNLSSNMTFYLDSLGFSWDTGYSIDDNQAEGMYLTFDKQFGISWYSISYLLDGKDEKTISFNPSASWDSTLIPLPDKDSPGEHNITLKGITGLPQPDTETPAPRNFYTFYKKYLDITYHSENDKQYPPGQIILLENQDLNITLYYKTKDWYYRSTWTNATLYYKINDDPWNAQHLGYGYDLQNATYTISETEYTDLDYLYYYLYFEQFDNSSRYLDSFYWTVEGEIQYDETLARKEAFQKKISPIPYELTLNYSVFYHHQITATLPTEGGGNITHYPMINVAYENITLNFNNITSTLENYNISCINESHLDHEYAANTGNISKSSTPQINYPQGIKSPFILPLSLNLTENPNIMIPEMFFNNFDPNRNLTFTGNYVNITYIQTKSWPYSWQKVLEFRDITNNIIVRYMKILGLWCILNILMTLFNMLLKKSSSLSSIIMLAIQSTLRSINAPKLSMKTCI